MSATRNPVARALRSHRPSVKPSGKEAAREEEARQAEGERPVRIAIIAAVAENGVIGRDNGLPWRLPTDLRHFRALTMGKPIVMGRRTFQSIGRPLDGRDNIVVSRDPRFAAEGVRVAASLGEALALAETLAVQRGVGEAFVVGGAGIYDQALPFAERLYITEVAARPEGDARFPPIDPAQWREVSRDIAPKTEKDSAAIAFVRYERV